MWKWIILGYLIFINIIGLLSMLIDKQRAAKGNWRLSENLLLLIAFLGGGIGSTIGMYICRHKTKHKKFTIFMPILSVISYILIAIIIYIFLF